MGQENNSWFARNRGVVFGFAIAILILNIVVLILVPTQTPISVEQTVTEYALADEAFAQAHTLTLTGTLTKSVLHSNLFHGTLTISGLDGMEEPYTLTLTREDGAWHGLSGEASILFSAGKEMDTLLIVLQGSQDVGADVHFLAPGAASRSAALTRLYTYYPAYRTK